MPRVLVGLCRRWPVALSPALIRRFAVVQISGVLTGNFTCLETRSLMKLAMVLAIDVLYVGTKWENWLLLAIQATSEIDEYQLQTGYKFVRSIKRYKEISS